MSLSRALDYLTKGRLKESATSKNGRSLEQAA